MEQTAQTRGGGWQLKLAAVLGVLLILTAISAGFFVLGRQTAPDEKRTTVNATPGEYDFGIMNEILGILKRDYVKQENLDDQTLYEAAIQGFLNVLNDSGTFYVDPSSFELDTALTGTFDGIGATISAQNGEIVIVSLFKEAPAEKAGIQRGDIIAAVDGESTEGWTSDKTALRIRGPRGSTVTVSIKHTDGKIEDYKIVRARVQTESVHLEPPEGTLKDANGQVASNLGYVQISEFSPRTAQELETAIRKVVSDGARGIILDVRRNLGGNLAATVSSIDLLLDNGTILVQRDASGRETSYVAKQGQLASDIPIVVLQDRFSASASEVLAAALQENGRATIIGEKSFGKGTVNTPRELPDGGAIFVTIAQWLTPKGRLIDKVGIIPDIEVIPTDDDIDRRRDPALYRAIDVLRGQVRSP